MRIRYERTMDDVMAFNDFYFKHSPTMKRLVFRYRWTSALAILVFVPALAHLLIPTAPLLFLLCGAVLEAAFFVAYASRIIRRKSRRNVLKMYAEGQNAALLGAQELELTDTGLIARSNYTETKLAWGAIERIETTPDHTFLYLSSVQAYVIPHNKIIEGDYPTLMAEIGRRFQPGQKLQQTIT